MVGVVSLEAGDVNAGRGDSGMSSNFLFCLHKRVPHSHTHAFYPIFPPYTEKLIRRAGPHADLLDQSVADLTREQISPGSF